MPADDDTVAQRSEWFLARRASDGNREAIQSSCRQSLEELRQLMLGFDVDPKHTARLLAEWSQIAPRTATK
jgi:hypothetical protein